MGTSCDARKSRRLQEAFSRALKDKGLHDEIDVSATSCLGYCDEGPNILIEPENLMYHNLNEEDVPFFIEEHFIKGNRLENYILAPGNGELKIPDMTDINFFKHQRLVVLRNRGRLEPDSIDEYIAMDGYAALSKVLEEYTPESIIVEIIDSGLRGRGGAGFPTGRKWQICRNAPGNEKYIVCNADEGDPGAFMDRSILESDPHAVIEGMIIGARAIGANQGFVYIRDEYPLAVQRIKKAIQQAEDYGLLGDHILGSDFSFTLKIVRGAGAFVCGEETALLASIEGKVGRPRQRPPFPVIKGLWRKPTNINNVETWANVPHIIRNGAKWFSNIGTAKSKGTKIFSLVGKVTNTGLVEVPMGITLREVIFDIGAGIPGDKKFKAVQIGGPSGGCLPDKMLDIPIDYDQLVQAGAMMGSGGLIVMDETTCMVDLAKYFTKFLYEESCGKCWSCREGLRRMLEILTKITEGKAKEEDLDTLRDLAEMTKYASMCGLGQTAANPVLSTLKYFEKEYILHVRYKRCPAKVCKALINFYVIPERCTGCMRCVAACPTGAITGPRSEPHNIDQSKCIKCRACYEICKFNAIEDVIVDAIVIK
ncbi:NADH-quinone oxidoreductase subunit NuoF [candidate division KSB1 bacterium]|nr:NADH-quinone oxidoreductase subunit NuoF [candidate division KSB1 bacterium]